MDLCFSFSLTTRLWCIAATFLRIVYQLDVAKVLSLRLLISIKSTMIIDDGHHGIRLYEREVQPK